MRVMGSGIVIGSGDSGCEEWILPFFGLQNGRLKACDG